MTSPIEEAEAILAEDQAMKDWPSAQRGGARLQSHPRLLDVLSRLLAYHVGYRQRNKTLSSKVSALVTATFESTNGELRWKAELPKGKAPAFRRALVDLLKHYKDNPP